MLAKWRAPTCQLHFIRYHCSSSVWAGAQWRYYGPQVSRLPVVSTPPVKLGNPRLFYCRRVFLADLDQGRDRSGTDISDGRSPPAQQLAFIKLRGLPFAATPDKVLEFLGPDVDVLNRAEVGPGHYRAHEAAVGL